MNDKDRIKITKAMGIGCRIIGNIEGLNCWSFNPFTDANDDYAVLEWARNREPPEFWLVFCGALGSTKLSVDYQIGDNARAVLKVIE